jgi:hypothetical protein
MKFKTLFATPIAIVMVRSLSAIPPTLHVTPSGSLKEGVVFRLSDGISGGEIPFNVISVTVCKKLSDTQCLQISKEDGEQSVQAIRYGAKYNGLKHTQRPERLEAGRRYDVDIIAKHPSTLIFGFGHFKIDPTGKVIETSAW